MPDDHVTTEDLAAVGDPDWLEDTEELPPRPRRRVLAPTPLALLAVLLVTCGFIGGVLVEKGQTSSSEPGGGANLAARFAALAGGTGATAVGGGGAPAGESSTGSRVSVGGGFAGRIGGASAGTRPTIGQVAYVHGRTLYVESAEGNTIEVRTSAASKVTKTVTSNVKSIHPGETVVVQGKADADGAVTADSISVGGAGELGGGLGAFLGGGGRTGAGASGRGGGASGAGEGPVLFGK